MFVPVFISLSLHSISPTHGSLAKSTSVSDANHCSLMCARLLLPCFMFLYAHTIIQTCCMFTQSVSVWQYKLFTSYWIRISVCLMKWIHAIRLGWYVQLTKFLYYSSLFCLIFITFCFVLFCFFHLWIKTKRIKIVCVSSIDHSLKKLCHWMLFLSFIFCLSVVCFSYFISSTSLLVLRRMIVLRASNYSTKNP